MHRAPLGLALTQQLLSKAHRLDRIGGGRGGGRGGYLAICGGTCRLDKAGKDRKFGNVVTRGISTFLKTEIGSNDCKSDNGSGNYSDNSTSEVMTRLTPASVAAIRRLQSYTPHPPTTYYSKMPLTRRAAVLLLLFPDETGSLRAVLTLRSETLRNFAGQVALPGGKADDLEESAVETARREAWEEIGLPGLKGGGFELGGVGAGAGEGKKELRFGITHLTELPCSLSRTNLAVRPCVALLLPKKSTTGNGRGGKGGEKEKEGDGGIDFNVDITVDIESLLIPRLNPEEVAAVFTVPLEAFLMKEYDPIWLLPMGEALQGNPRHHLLRPSSPTTSGGSEIIAPLGAGEGGVEEEEEKFEPTSEDVAAVRNSRKWYRGEKISWYGKEWVMHEFMAPVWSDRAVLAGEGTPVPGVWDDRRVTPEEAALRGAKEGVVGAGRRTGMDDDDGEGGKNGRGGRRRNVLKHFRVWGMTSRILLDAARIAYGREPEFECMQEVGDEKLLGFLWENGVLKRERFQGEEEAIGRVMRERGNL